MKATEDSSGSTKRNKRGIKEVIILITELITGKEVKGTIEAPRGIGEDNLIHQQREMVIDTIIHEIYNIAGFHELSKNGGFYRLRNREEG